MQLVSLDQVFRLAPRAVDFFVERFGQAGQVGHDEAAVDALSGRLDTGDHSALRDPGLGGVAELGIAAHLALGGCIEAIQANLLGLCRHAAQQYLVAGQAEDVADPIALAPRHTLRPAVVAVAPDQDIDAWPAGANCAHDVAQHQADLGAVRCLARPQENRDRLGRNRLVDVDRHEAAAVMMRVEQRKLLLPIGSILGVVDVEDDAAGHLLETDAEQLKHHRHHPLERDRAGEVLKPRHGRLRTQISSPLRQTANRHLKGGILAQHVAVIGIRIARRIVLDIDDTEDRAYGQQQLSLFNAHHDSRCFMPIHIYEAISAKPVAVFLRPGKTPDGTEVCLVLRHVVRAIRARWPRVDILIRGDSHYGRPEGMAWCERNRVGYIFGLAGNKVLLRRVTAEAEQVGLDRLDAPAEGKVRRYAEFRYAAKTWVTERRVLARVGASAQGVDSRFIVTNLAGLPNSLYEKIYCARGQAENRIKAHKLHLASDRTSCTKATANQFRLLLHTAAYWMMHTLRGLAPKASFWRDAQFDTLRLSLIKVAVRVTELVTKIKISLPTDFAYQHGFSTLAARLAKPPP